MSRANLGIQTIVTTTASASLEIIAGQRPVHVMEIDVALVAATASEIGIGIPAAKGVTPTLIAPIIMGGADINATSVRVAVAWGGAAPTVPARFFRRTQMQALVGTGYQFLFDDFKSDKPNGILLPAGGSLVIWNLSTVSLMDVSLILEEKWGDW